MPSTKWPTPIDRLCEVEPAALGDGETIEALHRHLARLEAVVTRAVAAFDASGAWKDDGARSAAGWVAFSCRLPSATARRRVAVGRALRQMPEVEAAWVAGSSTAPTPVPSPPPARR